VEKVVRNVVKEYRHGERGWTATAASNSNAKYSLLASNITTIQEGHITTHTTHTYTRTTQHNRTTHHTTIRHTTQHTHTHTTQHTAPAGGP